MSCVEPRLDELSVERFLSPACAQRARPRRSARPCLAYFKAGRSVGRALSRFSVRARRRLHGLDLRQTKIGRIVGRTFRARAASLGFAKTERIVATRSLGSTV